MQIISRKDTKAQGLKHYFTGKPCKFGHVCRRLVSAEMCEECGRIKARERQRRILATEEGRAQNREKTRKNYARGYYKQPARRATKAAYIKEQRVSNTKFKLLDALRHRLYLTVRRYKQSPSALQLVGCSIDALRQHLEAQFADGMTWDNYGDWHIDHIRPCASFDLLDPEQQRECFHYTNLQPLWAADNLSKSDTWQ